MRITCLATDYDGTLAKDGVVDPTTIEALVRWKGSGRSLVLVTGRELADLAGVLPRLDLFDRVVAENGGTLFDPSTSKELPLAPAASAELVAHLRAAGATPLSVGRTIVATWEPFQHVALEAIHDLGLELEIIFNKGAVMILPTGVSKATGLQAALDALQISLRDVVAVGDAENDHAFMRVAGLSAAVANALPRLKQEADIVTQGARGAGVTELIERILAADVDRGSANDGQTLSGIST